MSHLQSASDSLLAWMQECGASVDNVSIEKSALAGGLGLFAAVDIPPGGEVFRCPCRLTLTAEAAMADPSIGAALTSHASRIDRHMMNIVYLLHCRQSGLHAAYISCLPNDVDDDLPQNWPDEEQSGWLRGTSLLRHAREGAKTLRSFHEEVLDDLCARHPEAFPREAYNFRALCWAHAVYWSRAIGLTFPGGKREALVPLLDLCNHRPGVATTVSLVAASTEPTYALRASGAIKRGQEIFINYGAKGTGELLRCHGFTLLDNSADVCELDLSELPSFVLGHEGASRRSGLGLDACMVAKRLHMMSTHGVSTSSRSRERPLVCQLFRGGLPPQLLPSARLLCADEGDELRAALEEWRAGADVLVGSSSSACKAFDWSLVDWSAPDPFAVANAAVEEAAPVGVACEQRTLRALEALLRAHLDALPSAPELADDAESQDDEARRKRRQNARVYVESQRSVLEEVRHAISDMLRGRPPPTAAGEPQSSKRVRHVELESAT